MEDNKIDFFDNEFKQEDWNSYSNCFKDIVLDDNMPLELPEDVMKSLIGILGKESALKWINLGLKQFGGLSAIELSKNKKQLNALKAFIMRMPN